MNNSSRSTRRRALRTLGALALAGTSMGSSAAEEFPAKGKPIRLVVGMAGGAGLDAQARVVADQLTKILGTTVFVDNRPGAAMMLAAQEVARAPADGYTLMYAASSVFAQNPHTMARLAYHPFRDFTPISLGARGPLVLVVHESLGVSSVAELVALGRKRPQGFVYGSFGVGSSSHIYGELFAKRAGIPCVHVPFKGGAEIAKELLSGRIDFIFDAAAPAIQNAKSGRARIIGIAAPRRNPQLPDVPTMTEQDMAGMQETSWLGFFGPSGMEPGRVARLHDALARALRTPEVTDLFRRGAYEPEATSPAELSRIVRESHDAWGVIVRNVGMPKQ